MSIFVIFVKDKILRFHENNTTHAFQSREDAETYIRDNLEDDFDMDMEPLMTARVVEFKCPD